MAARDPRIHVGLGKAKKVDTLRIRWPSGVVDRLHDVPSRQQLIVEEGQGSQAPAQDATTQ